MADKVISSSTNLGYTLKLEMDETINIEANTSPIDWALVLYATTYNFSGFRCGWSVSLGGNVVSSCARSVAPQIGVDKNSSVVIASGTYTQPHDADGTKTIVCSASTDIGGSPAPGGQSLSGSWVLTAIPRESTMTVPSLTIGTSATFSISRNSNTYTHTILWAFAGQTGTVGTNIGTSVSWTPPNNTFLPLLPNSTSGEITFTLITLSGSTEIGRNTYTGTLNVASSVKPKNLAVSVSKVNPNAWIASKNAFVQGFSAVEIIATFEPGEGATGGAVSITGDIKGNTTGSGATFRSDTLTKSGTLNFAVTVFDSRGRSLSSATQSITVLPYTAPKLTISAERGEYSGGVWTPLEDGDHIAISFAVSLSLSSLSNACAVVVACEGQASQTVSGTSGTVYFTGTQKENSYTVSVSATDSVGVESVKALTVPTAQDPLNINTSLPGIGVGKVASTAELLDSAWDILAPGFRTGASSGLLASDGHGQLADVIEDVTGTSSLSFTLPEESGKTIYFSGAGENIITIPTGTPVGWKCTCVNARAASTMTFNRSGSDQFYVRGVTSLSTSYTDTIGFDTVEIVRTSSTRLVLVGGSSGSGTGVDWSDITGKPAFAAVATSGDYDDLIDTPSLATVATTGDYDDLLDKPTIPAQGQMWFGTSSTAAGTAAKTTTITGFPATLTNGLMVAVRFSNTNSIASPTLSINGGTAVAIRRYGSTTPSTSAGLSWQAGTVVLMCYYSSYWYIVNWLNSTYSEITVANVEAVSGTGTGLMSGRRFTSGFNARLTSTAIGTALGYTPADADDIPTAVSELTNDSGYLTLATLPIWNGGIS